MALAKDSLIMSQAEVYHGDDTCREKLSLLLSELGLPARLVTSPDLSLEEYGFVKAIGLVWLKLRNRTERRILNNIVVSYDTVVSAYVEPGKVRRLTGVRAKEFLIWMKLTEIQVGKDDGFGSITFKTPIGISRSFPVSMFVDDDDRVGRGCPGNDASATSPMVGVDARI
ncbi:hypothetical protein MLD38_038767 [Melastoma candidum]|uniref:Uncharacterized protein n=1 Tax=Melastoma candidum TaxID=119954 RepID=A0ACB9L170_9MYRT|nr:hypothetical protein MLD38_038767 [Melastoma candidum]